MAGLALLVGVGDAVGLRLRVGIQVRYVDGVLALSIGPVADEVLVEGELLFGVKRLQALDTAGHEQQRKEEDEMSHVSVHYTVSGDTSTAGRYNQFLARTRMNE